MHKAYEHTVDQMTLVRANMSVALSIYPYLDKNFIIIIFGSNVTDWQRWICNYAKYRWQI